MTTIIRKTFTHVMWTVALLYLVIIVLLRVATVQHLVGSAVASALAGKLGTKVEVGRVDLGFLNRIVIDDVLVHDHQQRKMLQASRLSAKIDVLALLEGRVRISSVQLFGLNAQLYQTTAQSAPNFLFVIDSLKSKSSEPSAPLDIQIQSIILRNGRLTWNQQYKPRASRRLDPAHLSVSALSTHLALYTLTDDTLSAKVKRLTLKEQSGLDLRSLTLSINAGRKNATLSDFRMELPQSEVTIKSLTAQYRLNGQKLDSDALRYQLKANASRLTLSDFAFLEPRLASLDERLSIGFQVDGSKSSLRVNHFSLENAERSLLLRATGSLTQMDSAHPGWSASVKQLHVGTQFLNTLGTVLPRFGVALPEMASRVNHLDFKGECSGLRSSRAAIKGQFESGVGYAALRASVQGKNYDVALQSTSVDIGRLLADSRFGIVEGELTSRGTYAPTDRIDVSLNTAVRKFYYNGYTYQNLKADGNYHADTFSGTVSMDDPNGRFRLSGRIGGLLSRLRNERQMVDADLMAEVDAINLHRLQLTDALGDRTIALNAECNMRGSSPDDLNGMLHITDFSAVGEGRKDVLQHLQLTASSNALMRTTTLSSDFGDAQLQGLYTYATLLQSFANVLNYQLPSLQLSPLAATFNRKNHFSYSLNLRDAQPLRQLLNIPLETSEPIVAEGTVDERNGGMTLNLSAPDFAVKNNRLSNLALQVQKAGDSLQAHVSGARIGEDGKAFKVDAQVSALNDQLALRSRWQTGDNTSSNVSLSNGAKPLAYGTLNAGGRLFREKGQLGVEVQFLPSVAVLDTVSLALQPSQLTYVGNRLDIDRFEVSNGHQHIIINGSTTGLEEDSLTVDLQNLNVAYILDLVNFHSVDFTGTASGTASVRSLFHHPAATAHLQVDDFTFCGGQMGTLHANVGFDGERVAIDAVADDGPEAQTLIGGYVSIKDSYIDLPIQVKGTRLQFLESFCGSFMDNVQCHGEGFVRVVGTLKDVNLEGDVKATGTIDVKPLRTTYELRSCPVHIVPDHITFPRDTVYDQYGHLGIVTGGLHHEALRHLTYDVQVEAQNLLAYDHKTYGSNTFYGTVFATGTCDIRGKSGEMVMDVNATTEKGSFIEYNATDETFISDADFIRWNTPIRRDSVAETTGVISEVPTEQPDIPSDMRINFLVNTNQNFTLRVLMDEASGDYIALNGDGTIRVNYFNKGAFQMFGNYNVDHGVYKLTIQNLIKKDFIFQPGSTIAFGGDPYNAALNLKGVYTVNGASLSDLQLGNSFTRNNVRVNCLMDITGTPEAPTVEFGLELPTLSSDAQAMVRSIINSEEDMNQQVLYLLAVGRFYPQGQNNATTQDGQQQNQTSLAMQSLLSGTISQQINTVLSNVIKNNDWSFGANISTGDEGFSNAEYEGLLSGRLFNNRLLFNGQFGYRDNVTTNTSSFIGDFDLRYLLTPNGSFAVRVYNQTNDRYFTRNSLNTQGLGVILKKDFNGLKDLFTWRKKSRSKAKKK